jgi:hypothetical protein
LARDLSGEIGRVVLRPDGPCAVDDVGETAQAQQRLPLLQQFWIAVL